MVNCSFVVQRKCSLTMQRCLEPKKVGGNTSYTILCVISFDCAFLRYVHKLKWQHDVKDLKKRHVFVPFWLEFNWLFFFPLLGFLCFRKGPLWGWTEISRWMINQKKNKKRKKTFFVAIKPRQSQKNCSDKKREKKVDQTFFAPIFFSRCAVGGPLHRKPE